MKKLLNGFTGSSAARRELLPRAVAFFLTLGMVFSFPLWQVRQTFPRLPVWEGFLTGWELDIPGLAYGLPVLLMLVVFGVGRLFLPASLLVLAYLLLRDQLRWQPWVYLYTLLLIPFAWPGREQEKESNSLTYFQLIMIGVYAWSGLHKFHPNFIDGTFRLILTRLFRLRDPAVLDFMSYFGYGILLLEVGIAALLWWPRTRKAGVVLAVLSHVFILIYLSPLGINSNLVVYPWNVAMMVLVCLLFYGVPEPLSLRENGRWRPARVVIALLVLVLPGLNRLGRWDHYLSFALYTDQTPAYFLDIDPAEAMRISADLPRAMVSRPELDKPLMDVNRWAQLSLHVPFYPEDRTFRQLARVVCARARQPGKVLFYQYRLPLRNRQFSCFSCADLSGGNSGASPKLCQDRPD